MFACLDVFFFCTRAEYFSAFAREMFHILLVVINLKSLNTHQKRCSAVKKCFTRFVFGFRGQVHCM